MEYALILFGYCLHFNRNCLNPYSIWNTLWYRRNAGRGLFLDVLILILMEHSLIITSGFRAIARNSRLNPYSKGTLSDVSEVWVRRRRSRLNPYSNGILSDNLTESTLRFQPFIFPNNFLLKIRELIHSELYFRKCKHSEHTFQTKKGIFQQITFISSKLHLRKRNPCLNNIRDLRKPTNRAFDNSLIMNTKCQRTNRHECSIFANVITKTEKTNICELFHINRNN